MTGSDRFAAFDTKADEPVTIVFGTFNYRKTIEKWIAAVHKLGYDGWRIVCMDRELVRWLEKRGDGARAVDYYAVLPDAPRYDFGTLPRKALMQALMPLRTRLFLQLATAGCDFVHSDADAFWIRDPRPYLARHREYDLLMSQGKWYPFEHYEQFGFVLCAGFFVCRSNARTRAYFGKVEALLDQNPQDQFRMNKVLQLDPEVRWEAHRPVLRKRPVSRRRQVLVLRMIRKFALYQRVPVLRKFKKLCNKRKGTGWKLVNWQPAAAGLPSSLPHREWMDVRTLMGIMEDVRSDGNFCVITSESVIRGRFSDGLTVGVIPMHLVTRGEVISKRRSLITH